MKCKINGCINNRPYKLSKNPYCHMHLARYRRHGNFELQSGFHKLELLPHEFVDTYILKHCKNTRDEIIASNLYKLGYEGANHHTVKYRRRKLGIRKYEYGDVKKHKAWIRFQAIKRHGNSCELCGYQLTVDVHHVLPKHKGGPHEIDNLMVVCPNCHALITRRIITLSDRNGIRRASQQIADLRRATGHGSVYISAQIRRGEKT